MKARHTCRGFARTPLPDGAIEKILVTADEPPILARGNDTPIVPGMCLVLTAATTADDHLVLHADTIAI